MSSSKMDLAEVSASDVPTRSYISHSKKARIRDVGFAFRPCFKNDIASVIESEERTAGAVSKNGFNEVVASESMEGTGDEEEEREE